MFLSLLLLSALTESFVLVPTRVVALTRAAVRFEASNEQPSEENVFRATGIRGSDLIAGGNSEVLRDATAVVFASSSVLAIATSKLELNFLSYLFALIPIVFVSIGSSSPDLIEAVLERDRRAAHEAAHFVAGHLCGLTIEDFSVGWNPRVEFRDDGKRDRDAVETLAAVALSGAVAECVYFGSAKGVAGDLKALQNILDSTTPPYSAKEQRAATRRAVKNAHKLLFSQSGDENTGSSKDLVKRVEAAMRLPEADLDSVLAALK